VVAPSPRLSQQLGKILPSMAESQWKCSCDKLRRSSPQLRIGVGVCSRSSFVRANRSTAITGDCKSILVRITNRTPPRRRGYKFQ
jgi:hypothetical protein